MKTQKLLSIIIAVVLLSACTQADPIIIYVTPTQGGPTIVPTVVPLETSPPPTVTETALPTATVTSLPPTPGEGTDYGPIIPADYTMEPTATSRPTDTPIPLSPTNTLPPSITPTPTISPTPPPGLNPANIGIQIHPRIDQGDWREMLYWGQQLGVGWVKIQFPWDEMESDGPHSQTTFWRELELYTQDALGRGFNVMISIAKAPDWARPTNEQNGPPSDPQALADFTTDMLNQFGKAIHAIEIWNEPNLEREWYGVPMNGAEYMRLFGPTYHAIKNWSAENSHPIQIVTAGLAPVGNVAGAVDDRDFLRQMYEAGLADYPDVAIGIHPYSWGNSPLVHCCDPVEGRSWDDDPHFFFLDTVETYHEIMQQYGDTDSQLWATEFGWATYDGLGGHPAPQGFFEYITEATQAQYLIEALDLMQNSGNYPYMGPMIVWNLNYAMVEGAVERGEEQAGYGLMRQDGSWRPVMDSLYQALPHED